MPSPRHGYVQEAHTHTHTYIHTFRHMNKYTHPHAHTQVCILTHKRGASFEENLPRSLDGRPIPCRSFLLRLARLKPDAITNTSTYTNRDTQIHAQTHAHTYECVSCMQMKTFRHRLRRIHIHMHIHTHTQRQTDRQPHAQRHSHTHGSHMQGQTHTER